MIYSRYGTELTIDAYCGQHEIPNLRTLAILVRAIATADLLRATLADPADVQARSVPRCYFFAHTLKADGGPREIDAAIDGAAGVRLMGLDLKAAMRQAE